MFVRAFKRFSCVPLLFFVIGISIRPVYGQAAKASAPFNNFGPITDYSTAQTDSFDSSHVRKGARYGINNSQVPELGENSEPNLFDLPRSHTSKTVSATDYDTIVVGTVTGGQSYLSNDKRNIYSEFKITLQEVIKGPAGLVAGQSIDIERSGGALRLPSGKILLRGSLTESMPQVGKRYAFILQSRTNEAGFILKTGYQLEGTHVYCIDNDQKNVSTLNHPLKEHGGTENQLIEQLKKSVSNRGN